ncbi:MAG: thiolase family protein [Proteobacteria bacterium]|nr:thiolase family protein [Pseudomonadota bacterium]MBU4469814.1 thiolase family protein [Pseudomonadota bacterium]MCG2753049.1 thiolase family protein [Desulfobacteraceae bacterium]
MKECVVVDGVRSPNFRAHAEKGWARNLRIDEILTQVYEGLFAKNPKVKPEDVDALFCGSANQSGPQADIARLGWLAGGFPESVGTCSVGQQCPSGMAAVEFGARTIMCGEADIVIASGAEDMLVGRGGGGGGMDMAPRLAQRYNVMDFPMGMTAEKVGTMWNVSKKSAHLLSYHSNINAAAAVEAGKFKDEIIPIKGCVKDDGSSFVCDKDQWVRPNVSMEKMESMQPAFKEGGLVTAAGSSPLTSGACAVLLMSREKADALGYTYHIKYAGGTMAGCDPTVMGIGPLYAAQKLLKRKGLDAKDIGVWELNEAFGTQGVAVLRELGLGDEAPFKNVNVWGGALALGHPLGESGARIIITLNNIMKTDYKDAKYGLAMLCGGFGNANATLWQNVNK